MPVYRVDRDGQKPRVVEAADPRGARNHVANDEIKVTKIGTADAFRLASDGIKLETAGVEPEPHDLGNEGQGYGDGDKTVGD